MLTEEILGELSACTARLEAGIQRPALLSAVANDFLAMIIAYEHDGYYFIRQGDPVNGLASAAYALGWLDAGACMGLVRYQGPRNPDIYTHSSLPPALGARMAEKTSRYQRLLQCGISAVDYAPEPETPLYEVSHRFLVVAETYLGYGILFGNPDTRVNALFCFSYGFAWLDAGIRAGLFRITGEKEVFAL
jgi:uncharacterized protein